MPIEIVEPEPEIEGHRRPAVAVCVLTYERDRQLRALLDGISRLTRPDADVFVVVVDNKPDGGARVIVDEFRSVHADDPTAWPVEYVAEPQRGIARARNRATEAALRAGADFVAFIDDDEVPESDWLFSLCAVQASSRAEVVVGPVIPRFMSPPPRWVVAGDFFERPRRATGERVEWAITGNVLISRALLTRYAPAFDERFDLSGGEDTHFFMRARDDGAVMVSADNAVVFEDVPVERTSCRWIMRREYRRGNTLSLCMLDLHPSRLRRARRAGQGVYRIGQGLTLIALAPVRGGIDAYRGAHRVCFGVGLLTGLVGLRYEHYLHGHRNLVGVHRRA